MYASINWPVESDLERLIRSNLVVAKSMEKASLVVERLPGCLAPESSKSTHMRADNLQLVDLILL